MAHPFAKPPCARKFNRNPPSATMASWFSVAELEVGTFHLDFNDGAIG